uniref:(California timema) hypothetical protein n=1 Tax=Timema californicum TaxID=61474 RepID=A0A7R9P8P4_TIMCA|nr:unnamed protein product [Timema californicum]
MVICKGHVIDSDSAGRDSIPTKWTKLYLMRNPAPKDTRVNVWMYLLRSVLSTTAITSNENARTPMLLILSLAAAAVLAEPPVNSYLPPGQGRSQPSSQYGAPSSSNRYNSGSSLSTRNGATSGRFGGRNSASSRFNSVDTLSTSYGAPSMISSRLGGSSSISTQYGAPSGASSRFNAPSTQYGAPSGASSRFNSPSTQYGAPSGASSRFNAPSTQYDAPSGASSRFNSPSTQYGAPSGASSRFNAPSAQYGAPSGASSRFNAPSAQYGAPSGASSQVNALSNTYGAPSAFSRNTPSAEYGVPNAGYRGAQEDSLAEPANYEFNYEVQDSESGAEFGHEETRQDESAQGSYRVLLPDGRLQIVEYRADEEGYKPEIRYEETAYSRDSQGPYPASRAGQGPY